MTHTDSMIRKMTILYGFIETSLTEWLSSATSMIMSNATIKVSKVPTSFNQSHYTIINCVNTEG